MTSVLIDHVPKTERPRGASESRRYMLGHSDSELKRLAAQGAFYRDLTEDVLRRAGIAPGMRVLDLGCGVGDVSLMAGELVGPSGFVLGVDRSAEAVASAERRVVEAGQCYWVRFAAAELDDFTPDETFDAIIGRLILWYLPDPAATLRRLSSHLRPGGIVAFQEMTLSPMRSVPEVRQFSLCLDWILGTYERNGLAQDMGDQLFTIFLSAGLPDPKMLAAGRVEGGPQSPVYDYVAETVRTLLPAMERVGVATAAEVEVDTLAERLRKETVANDACIMLPPLVGAWTQTPV